MKANKLIILNIITLLFMLVMNTIAVVSPLAGHRPADVSNHFDNLFVPAGITFSIWSIIYLLLITFCVVQFIQVKKRRSEITLRIGYLFAISNIANGLWIVAWSYLRIGLSVILMLTILLSLIMIHTKLKIGYRRRLTTLRKYTVFVPFSIYLGWISVATIANIAALIVSFNLPFGDVMQTLLTMIVIAIAGLLACISLRLRTDYYFASVIIFALSGIIIKRLQSPPLNSYVAMMAFLTIMVIIYNIYLTQSRKNIQRLSLTTSYPTTRNK